MKRLISFLTSILLSAGFLLSFLTACAVPTTTSSPQPVEIPPTPIPDTPAPVAINAPIIEAPALVSIRFLNERDGWGVTETQILRTNDGGVTWYNVTPPDVTETGYSVKTFALDTDRTWMLKPDFSNYPNSGFLNRTSDGGMSWKLINVPFSDAHMTFLDANNGWALAKLGAGAGSEGVAIFQTADGGVIWTRTYINDPNIPGAGNSLPLSGIKSGLTPLNMQTAWVSGGTYSDGTIYLYRTDDSGANWAQVESLTLPPVAQTKQVNFEPVQFVTAQDAFVVVHIPSDQIQMAVYVSNDAGDTWSLTPILIPGGRAADFLSATEAVIYNGEQFYVTRDAARTWSIIPPDVVFGESFEAMDFVNLLSGWVTTLDPTGHRSFYRTNDGGVTWFPVIP